MSTPLVAGDLREARSSTNARPNPDGRCSTPIAVTGMGCVFPGAPDVATFWENVLAGRGSISAVTSDRWDAAAFFDADAAASDRSYCNVGGFVRDWQFDGRAFRVPPATTRVMDRAQQYALTAASEAVAQAGLDRRSFDRDRTAVIIGIAAGRSENEEQLVQRVQLPLLERALHVVFDSHGVAPDRRQKLLAAFREEYLRGLVDVTEDTFAGLCPNVVAGRIANFFDLRGPSYVVDAACASSLAAVDCGVDSLRRGDVDLVICGGVHAHMGLSVFIGFSKFRGLSVGRVSPFDETADGFLLGEGAGLFVLKRLDEAVRDGDRVLAVIRGVGSSSDGRQKGMGAPNPSAQALAIRRAMDEAGYSPATVQYLEAHGAGTAVGDPAELGAALEVFGPHLAPGQRIAVGAIKSHVGHLMGAAGAAGLMATVLGLHHQVMPPTLNHTRPNPAIPWETLPFEVVTAPRPWVANRDDLPRRANVSAFGFGGNNFHLALEGYDERWHRPADARTVPEPLREPIAIVGLGACLPQSPDVETFWQNVVERVSAIVEIPPDRWDGEAGLYVDSDPDAADKSHSRIGGFATTPRIDSRALRISPATLSQIDPGQKQLLASAVIALNATQILASADERRRTAVIFGDSGGSREMLWLLLARFSVRRAEATLQRLARDGRVPFSADEAHSIGAQLVQEITANRPPITEDSVVGIATSIGAARITKSLDLMGTHMVVDAACASSLTAIALAVRGLQSRKWDAVVTGGVAGGVTPHLSVIACKARAHSATGSRPFDAEADGFVAGEGAVVFVLKRLSDAMTAGDRVYSVIRGIGASTNGRGQSMYAPNSDAEALALSRAYANSGLKPSSVQYVECHATSTSVGDTAELSALQKVFGDRAAGSLHVGSVKAQIGHTMAAAGAAGLLKTVLGLDRKTLPPMPPVATPIAGVDDAGPFRLVTAAAPWPALANGEPRRAAVNSFGFGGTNWHVIVEEFVPAYHEALLASFAGRSMPRAETPVEAMAVQAATPSNVLVAAGTTSQELRAAVGRLDPVARRREGNGPWRIAFVAHSKTDFESKVDLISKHYRPGGRSPLLEANGIFATADQAIEVGPVAGLFPGQGPQYADMLRDLADEHDIVRRTVAEADDVLRELVGETYAQLMFTATRTAEERSALEQSLSARSDIVQPVLVTAGVALHRLATAHGVRFETLAGHSLGEYAALVSAGVLEFAQAVRVAHARGQAFRDLAARSGHAGLMATVAAGADVVAAALEGVRGYVTIANRNCPLQTVISGEDQPLRDALIRLEGQGIECRVLPIAGAFHSRLADAARARMQQAVAALTVRAPSTRVLSSVDLAYYEPSTDCGARVRSNLVEQLVTPVDFIGLVERLHADGVDRFIEIGPKNALTGFVDDILGDTRAHRSLFMNHPKIGEIPQLDRFVAQYALLDPPPAPQQTPRARELDRDVPSFASGRRPGRPALPSPDRIWITGVSIGLPGRTSRVFSDDGLERLLAGACFIEPISESLQDRMVAKRITRLVKSEDGEPYLADVTSRADVVKLAGQRGGFSLREDFGLEDESLENADIAYQLAVAAGFECLRDARIPLQRAYKRTSRGGSLRGGWMLPAAMQDDTAVVFASAFPGHNALYQELERYYASTYGAVAASTIRDQYLRRLQAAQTEDERLQADQWFVDQRRATNLDGHCGAYRFNRNFLADYSCMGNTRFAQLVRARGPNLAVNATCCSTAVALATAEDIIRCGRARRVVVLAADDVSSDVLFEWIGAGFLAAGAAATDSDVADAAIPFDRRRHGVIVGMGAVGFVVEAESAARERSLDPVAELLGVRVANSASHMTRPDAEHVVTEMKAFLADMEARHAVDSRGLASNVVYGSHETFTLPSGGIGAVEGRMLKQVFGDRWRDVVVVNTKCSTGHAQGASLADAILIKALQAGKVPPVLHSTDIDPDLAGINLSTGGTTDREYALGFSAGFGSQVAMWLTRVVTRAADRVTSEIGYRHWLEGITGIPNASVTVVKRMLLVDEASTTDIAGRPVAPAVTPVAAPRRELDTTPAPAPAGPAVGPPVPASVPAVSVPVRETVVAAPVPEAAGVQRAAHSEAAITAQVMTIIEEKTGYEREYLELDLDLEADLGVDTIKQAQVMARIRETFGLPKDKSIRVKDFPTLRHVVNYVQAKLDDGAIASQSVRIDAAPWQPPVVEGKSPVIGASPLGPSVVTAAESSEVAQIVPDGSASSQPAAEGNHADQRVLDVVLAIVEKLTGYEREALGQDLDLEADLGIDTIKQAQVMARIRDEFNLPREQGIRVKDFPTIRHVVGYITSRVAGPRVVAPAHRVETAGGARESRLESPMPAASAPRQLEGSLPSGIHRMAVRSSPHPPSDERPNAQLGADWTLLLTDDGLGVAEALSRMLFERGARVEILGQGQEIAAARARLGRVRGLVLLHPLATDPAVAALDAAAWREVLDRKVLASFQAVKTLQSDLEMVVGVTAMSGPYGWRGQLVDPAGSGVAGFLKALRQEADGVLVKVIDVERPAARAEAERLAAAILTEIEHGGTRVEVAYRDAVRLVPRVVRESLDLSAASQRKISADSVIVAIGGSRGVTAAVVKELARRYGPRLVLVGKQPLPAKVAQLAALDRDGLKQHKDSIARGWKTRVMGTKPIEIERKYAATLHAIEAFRTIQACEAAGSVVSYHACDVRDANGVREMVKSVVRQHGGIDGVIFGAGIIEDKLIEGKTLESFARVFGVKAEGMFNVYKALDGVSLSFLAAFSSVAGRFGNVGQGDYAAGNEVMTRLVSLMQAARPSTRCVAFDWTGWDEVGLAARSGVIELMKDSGFEALSPDQGARLFHEELIYGAGPEEIVIAGEHLPVDKDGQIDVAGHVVATTPERQHAGVFLGVVHSHEKGAWVSATTTIEPRVNGWLRDHVIDGAALLPAVFGIEMMAEAASLLFPDLHLWGVRDLQLHLAVKVLKDRATPLNVIAVGRTGDTDDERVVAVEVTSDFIGGDGRVLIANRVHYTCDVLLRSTPPVSAWRDDGRAARASVATAIPRLYGEGGALPHGPTFQVLERVDGMDADGIVASVAAVDESLVFPALNGHRLLTLPFAREAAFQAAGLWGIVRHENFGLPHGCRALHTFGAPPRGTKLLVRVVAKVVDIVRMEYDIDLIGDDGRLYDRMEGFYTVNPLAAAERAAHELGSETAE